MELEFKTYQTLKPKGPRATKCNLESTRIGMYTVKASKCSQSVETTRMISSKNTESLRLKRNRKLICLTQQLQGKSEGMCRLHLGRSRSRTLDSIRWQNYKGGEAWATFEQGRAVITTTRGLLTNAVNAQIAVVFAMKSPKYLKWLPQRPSQPWTECRTPSRTARFKSSTIKNTQLQTKLIWKSTQMGRASIIKTPWRPRTTCLSQVCILIPLEKSSQAAIR